MNMIRGLIRIVMMTIVAILLVGGSYLGGYAVAIQLLPPPASAQSDSGVPSDWTPNFKVFWEAWNYIHQDFYKVPIDDQKLVNGSIGGMVDSLGDAHTSFSDSKSAALSRSDLQGSFEGIGATVEMREGRLTIVAPITGSPAEKAGLLPGDIIMEVNDTVIQGMDVMQAIALIRGPKGSTATLKVQRAKQAPFTVSIVRDTIRTTFVSYRMIEGTNIAYIRLNDFGATAPDELAAALNTLRAQNPKGLVFDVRSNPGGYLNVAVDVASQFLKAGQPVLIEKDKNGNVQQLRAKSGGLATDIPMVLLIDGGSASASEILAGAVRDYKRATIIGVKTYGKGSVQNVHTLSDKSELRVTIAHFFSPLDREINDVGIEPDIEVKITEDDIAKKRDPQLDKAVEILKSKLGTSAYLIEPQWTDLAIAV